MISLAVPFTSLAPLFPGKIQLKHQLLCETYAPHPHTCTWGCVSAARCLEELRTRSSRVRSAYSHCYMKCLQTTWHKFGTQKKKNWKRVEKRGRERRSNQSMLISRSHYLDFLRWAPLGYKHTTLLWTYISLSKKDSVTWKICYGFSG